MPSKLNQLSKDELATAFKDVDSAIFVDFTGVGSAETYDLRKSLHEQKIKMRVVKSTVARIALKDLGNEVKAEQFKGPIGVVYAKDPVAAAKALLAHKKKYKKTTLEIKGGFVGRKGMKPEDVTALSNLPDKKTLLASVVGTLAAPITGFVNVHASILSKLVYAIDAVREKREKSA